MSPMLIAKLRNAAQQATFGIEALEELNRAERRAQLEPEVCLAAVQQDGHAIQLFTEAQRTPEVCLAAVQQNGFAVWNLTKSQRTPEVCMAAVQCNGYAIHCLTDEQRTPEVSLAAVQKYRRALVHLTAQDVSHEGAAGDQMREAILSFWEEYEQFLPNSKRQELAQALLACSEAAPADREHASCRP